MAMIGRVVLVGGLLSLGVAVSMGAGAQPMAHRGMHTLVGGRGSLPAVEKLITLQLPELHLNELILEINYVFQFKSHPEVVDGDPLTVADCRRLAALAKANGIHLIPMINCLGHQSWASHTAGLLRAHPELDETPDLPKDNKGIYCRSYCPSHPDTAKIVCALIDEVVYAFQADSFHVGMDEVFILGECPRCKGKPNAVLFAKAVNDLHAHIVGKRKLTMLMWGDRLLDAKATGNSKWEASENGTAGATALIPKDIVVCDWHYAPRDDYPSIAALHQAGFRVWPSGWNSAANAEKLAACALRHAGPLFYGYLATTWIGAEVTSGALDGDAKSLAVKDAAGVVAAIRAGAKIAWESK